MILKYYLIIDGDDVHFYDKGEKASSAFYEMRLKGRTGLDYTIAAVNTESKWPTIESWISQAYSGKKMLDHRNDV